MYECVQKEWISLRFADCYVLNNFLPVLLNPYGDNGTCLKAWKRHFLLDILSFSFWTHIPRSIKHLKITKNSYWICGQGSVVGIATGYRLDGPGSNPGGGEIFRTCPDRPWGPPSLLYNGYQVFPGVKSRRGVMLTPHRLLVPWSWKDRAIPLLPLWAVQPVQTSVPVQGCTLPFFLPQLSFRSSRLWCCLGWYVDTNTWGKPAVSIHLKTEAAGSYATLLPTYQNIQQHILQGCHL